MLASTGASGKNDLMKRFIDKSVDLDLLKELSKKHEETLVQKKQELSQEKKKLVMIYIFYVNTLFIFIFGLLGQTSL